jgi:predicted RNase H-like HicB family nuclease
MRYAIVIEKADGNCSPYAPDLPGRVVTAGMPQEAEDNMREVVCFHLEELAEDGPLIPPAQSSLAYAGA